MIFELQNIPDGSIQNKTVCFGHFSYLHAGHLRYFNYASKFGQDVYVAISSGPNDRSGSAFDVRDRVELLKKLCDYDHFIVLGDNSLLSLIYKLRNCTLVLGRSSLKHSSFSEIQLRRLLEKVDSVLELLEGDEGKSLEQLSQSTEDITSRHIEEFQFRCLSNSIDLDKISVSLAKPSNSAILVIGDLIVDEYIATEPLGISAEAPVIVVREIESKRYVGGAGVVAKHLSCLGSKVSLLSVVGDDDEAEFISQNLCASGVEPYLITDPSRPTIHKKRYISGFTKLLRVSRISKSNLTSSIEDKLIEKLDTLIRNCDCIVISDFQYGVFSHRIASCIEVLSRRYGKRVFVDVQCSSQIGRINKLDSCFAIFPTEKEARITTADRQSDIERLGEKVLKLCNSSYCVLKLGEEGLILFERDSKKRFQLPALSSNPVDVAGAGDSLLASVVHGYVNGLSMKESVTFGAIVASLNVENLGNEPVVKDKILKRILSIC